ncbi:hypothetical protein [Labrys monachus]|uniref:Uncharacterized protein n=1 Tax=Labrys monachus TaxID=217067 RepID=A0ABU0FN26_9HYPH|nr:hypothetical protein [Labrys monachus]MDQ0396012.1 hypothetical protein [Labrys monachus]
MMNNLFAVCSVFFIFWLCGGFRRTAAYFARPSELDPCEHFIEPPK